MSTEIDLATELAAVKAQLKEQTQQMAEMMSLAMPLLEEQTRKLRKEKEEEEARKKAVEELARKSKIMAEHLTQERAARQAERAAKIEADKAAVRLAQERAARQVERAAKVEADKAIANQKFDSFSEADEQDEEYDHEQYNAALEQEVKDIMQRLRVQRLKGNKQHNTAEAEEKKIRDTLPMGRAQGDFYQEKSQTWWRCPSDDKLHVFRWEKGGSELLVNWKGEAWGCRRAGAGFGEIMYEYANEGNWIGVYVRGEDRWDSSGRARSANIPPPPSGPSYPNGRPGDSVMITWDYSSCSLVPGAYPIPCPRVRGGRY